MRENERSQNKNVGSGLLKPHDIVITDAAIDFDQIFS
jgi:hypothetical protein